MLGTSGDGRYRVVGRVQMVQALLHQCWPHEVRAGGEVAAAAGRRAEEALERWIGQGLPCRIDGGHRFDPFEVYNFMVHASASLGDPTYADGPVRTMRRAAAKLRDAARQSGPDYPRCGRSRHEVRLRREFHLEFSATGAPARLRVPLPFDDQTQRDVTVELVEPDPTTAEFTRGPSRIEIRIPGPVGGRVAVEILIRFEASCEEFRIDPSAIEPWDRSDPDFELYTQRSEGLIQVTDFVAQLAESLARTARGPWEAVVAFWRFSLNRMAAGRVHHDDLIGDDPLATLVARGWSDCFTGSSLLASLCRARGIPARIINGFTLYDVIPTNHYWVEAFIPPYGWIPMDLSNRLLAGSGSERGDWDDYYLGRLDFRMKYQCLPRLIVGPPGLRFPTAWYMINSVREGGMETSYYGLNPGVLLYRDWIRVRRESNDPGPPSIA
jgi:transglutaminase-like putative cysteine protease